MKTFIFGAALVLAMLLSADNLRCMVQAIRQYRTGTPERDRASTKYDHDLRSSGPGTPVLLLMSIGVGVFGLGYAIQRFRKQS